MYEFMQAVGWDWVGSIGSDIVSGLVSGVATAGVLALIALMYANWRRKKLIETIKESFRNVAYHEGDQIGIVLTNRTHVELVIRRVELAKVATEGHDRFEPGSPSGFLILRYEGPAEFGASNKDRNEEDSRGHVRLPAYSEGTWSISVKGLKECSQHERFRGGVITIQFIDFLNEPKIIAVRAGDNKQTASWFNHALDGKFDRPALKKPLWGLSTEMKGGILGDMGSSAVQGATGKSPAG